MVTRISETVTAMKAAMVGFEAIAFVLLLRLLAAAGLPAERIVVYAWHPLPVWEFAGNGHIDAALDRFVALALVEPSPPRQLAHRAGARRRGAGEILSRCAVSGALSARWDWQMPGVRSSAFIVLAYLPFFGVGWGVFGFLPGYLAEEDFTADGRRVLSVELGADIPPLSAITGVRLCIAAAIASLARGLLDGRFGRVAANALSSARRRLPALFMLLVSPHYPWYFAGCHSSPRLLPSLALLWLTMRRVFCFTWCRSARNLASDGHRMLVEVADLRAVRLAWRCSISGHCRAPGAA